MLQCLGPRGTIRNSFGGTETRKYRSRAILTVTTFNSTLNIYEVIINNLLMIYENVRNYTIVFRTVILRSVHIRIIRFGVGRQFFRDQNTGRRI